MDTKISSTSTSTSFTVKSITSSENKERDILSVDRRTLLNEIKEQRPFVSLSNAIYEILLQDIVSFKLRPGEVVSIRKIANALEVSRSPVKTAIEHLAEKDYLILQDGRCSVVEFSKDEYKSYTDIAMMLESYAAGEAAVNITKEELDFLYSLAEKLKSIYTGCINLGRVYDFRTLMDTELRFHTAIIDASKNALLQKIYREVRNKLFRYRSYLLLTPPPGIYQALKDDHLVLCSLIRLGDRNVAVAGAKRHLSISKNAFTQHNILGKLLANTYPAE
jgi:DNA-binding GntR family transcriptional regulator